MMRPALKSRDAMSFTRHLALASIAAWQIGCAAAADERPLTAADKEQLLRAAQAQRLLKDLDVSRCGSSSKTAQVQARNSGFSGADAFDSRNCPRQGGPVPGK